MIGSEVISHAPSASMVKIKVYQFFKSEMTSKVYKPKPINNDFHERMRKKLPEILAQQKKKKPVSSNQEKITPQKDSYKATHAIAKRLNTKKVVWNKKYPDKETLQKRRAEYNKKKREEEEMKQKRAMLK